MPVHGFDEFGEEVASIVSCKPDGWEYLLTVALMKEVLRNPVRRWRELQAGVLVATRVSLADNEVLPWVQVMTREALDLGRSLTTLYSKELQRAWGECGFEGNAFDIRDTILSISRTADQCVDWETKVKFTEAPELYVGLLDAFGGIIGFNLPKLVEAAEIMDAGLKHWQRNPDDPMSISHTVVFDVPPGFNDRIDAEIELISKHLGV